MKIVAYRLSYNLEAGMNSVLLLYTQRVHLYLAGISKFGLNLLFFNFIYTFLSGSSLQQNLTLTVIIKRKKCLQINANFIANFCLLEDVICQAYNILDAVGKIRFNFQ
ncbi:unnamed protein product [Moneuplotes crassus]|uniref:Uncharacterized protein n=1 Tax=Euplotes crassus TaxID=5936 RepID=A0AAD1XWA3_EUPCR|nr:unnamed protein product [Moneuplotes crassus]